MLSLGPGSSCDVCFEKFGQDSKAPWSIECGHVFCAECIKNIARLCPMCRNPFEQGSCIKLHVDLDLLSAEPPEGCTPADMREAQRIQHAIASIPETGATEPSLRQLIQEGNKFLQGQPRNSHKDLRNAHRIIAYLYEVKMLYRTQAQAIEKMKEQINQLNQEKADLRKQLEQLGETREYERETAAAVENTLREHCAQAKQAQKATAEQLKILEQENEDLKKQLGNISGSWTAGNTRLAQDNDSDGASSSTSFTMPSMFDKLDMKSVAIQDPSSFLISPLPQFTSSLPAMFDAFTPLPDLAEDDEAGQESTDEEDEEVATPDSSQHQSQLRGSQEIEPQLASEALSASRPGGRPALEPSGLSRTAPYLEHKRERSRSNPIHPTSRSQSPFDNVLTTTSPTPPVQTMTTYHATSSREVYPAPQNTNGPVTQDRQVLRSRLYDILSDPPTSSSLPIMSSSLPSSLANRDMGAARNDDRVSPPPSAGPSRSSETLVSPQQSTNHGASHLLASHSQPLAIKPPSSTSPNPLVGQRMSSASAEAKKLEEERRRRYREEKYGPEQDRQPVDADRETRRHNAPSNLSGGSSTGSSSASQAARREQQPYGNPLNSNTNSMSASSWRAPTASAGTYGRQGPSLPPSQSSQEQGSASQTRYPHGASNKPVSKNPVLPSNPTGIYA